VAHRERPQQCARGRPRLFQLPLLHRAAPRRRRPGGSHGTLASVRPRSLGPRLVLGRQRRRTGWPRTSRPVRPTAHGRRAPATSSTSLPAPQPSARSTAMAACGAGATRRPAMPTACVGVGPVWPRPRRSPVSTGQRPSASSSSATPRPACVASPAQLSASTTGDTRAWRPSRASTASSGPARARSVIWREFHCGP
jgi:hypothetical protein